MTSPTPDSNRSPPSLAKTILGGFNRYSLISLAVLLVIYSFVFGAWWRLIDQQELRDPLLWSIWGVMSVLFCWNVRPLLDLELALIGGAGGLVIEWWGTNTEVWWYFTGERPPLFIIPAWMVSAVVINRVATTLAPLYTALRDAALLRGIYWTMLAAFGVLMTVFIWPYRGLPSTWVFFAIMLVVPWIRRRPLTDIVLFLVGAFAGVFFEYWGTSRACWTYYTLEVPPLATVLAHGFSAVAFAHVVRALDRFRRPD